MKLDTSYLFDVCLSMLLEQQVVSGMRKVCDVCRRLVVRCYQVCEQGAATTTPKKK